MRFLKEHVRVAKELGYEVHYASNFNRKAYDYDEKEMADLGVICHQLDIEKSPLKVSANKKALKDLEEIIEKEKINIVDCHTPMGGALARMAGAKAANKPYVIYTAHGFHFYKGASPLHNLIYASAEKRLAKKTDALLTINKEDYEYALNHFELRQKKNVFWLKGMGVDISHFTPDLRIEEINKKRSEILVPHDAFHIVTIAEINKNKNQKAVVEAIAGIEDENIYYSICGRGPYEKQLKMIISDNKLDKRVKIIGYRNDVKEILQTADVFAFPSKREGLGLAALEALACEVPLIVTDNRGTREYAKEGVNALVCNGSEAEFKQAIMKLATDKELLKSLKSNCRESVKEFSIENVKKQISEIYKGIDKNIG